MENASKALLMAAAILIAILVLSALVIFKDDLAIYFSGKHESVMLQQMVEFNNKFQNYNGKTIRGSDLVSIMNKVVDYNNYQSEMVGYEKVKIEIDFFSTTYVKEGLLRDPGDTNFLFSGHKITNYNGAGTVDDSTIKNIAETSNNLSAEFGITDVQLQLLSSQISIILSEEPSDQAQRTNELTKIFGSDLNSFSIEQIKDAARRYDQFTQFKRAMFECTGIEYDETVGTVNKMTFEVILETDDFSGNTSIKFN